MKFSRWSIDVRTVQGFNMIYQIKGENNLLMRQRKNVKCKIIIQLGELTV
jgi:hypothetical protein